MLKRLLVLLVVCWGTFAVPSRAQEYANPYIYYFSDTANAFIIERAGEFDTRIMGADLIPRPDPDLDQVTVVNGPGWSPSGRWFAWTAQHVSLGYDRSVDLGPFVIHTDGSKQLTLLDGLRNVQLAWAAEEDVLFVASFHRELVDPDDLADTRNVAQAYLAVIDVEREQVIASFAEQIAFDDYPYTITGPTITRANDGQHFIVTYPDYEDGNLFYTPVVMVFGTDGTSTKTRLDAIGPISYQGSLTDFPSISPAGWVAYPTPDNFRAENVLTGETRRFTPLTDPDHIAWDASGQHALIAGGGLWWLDCAGGVVTRLRGGWYFRLIEPVWSPGGLYALLTGADQTLYGFNPTLTELSITARNDYGAWTWLDDTHALILSATEPGAFVYDLAALTVRYIPVEIPSNAGLPRLSPDGRFLAFIGEDIVVYDTATATTRTIPTAENTIPGGDVDWNESGEWLLLFEYAASAGGGGKTYLGIAHADGILRRDLGFSRWPSAITLDWLPPQVDPETLETYQSPA